MTAGDSGFLTKGFVHLRACSSYSLLTSTMQVSAIVKSACKYNMTAVAMTDMLNMFGALEFAVYATSNGIQPIIGMMANVSVGTDVYNVVLIAKNELGYKNIIKISGETYKARDSIPSITMQFLASHSDGIILLIGCCDGIVTKTSIYGKKNVITELLQHFGDRMYLEVQRYKSWQDHSLESFILDAAYELNIPIVATNSIYFQDQSLCDAHDTMLCIADGKHVSQGDRRRSQMDFYFKTSEEMRDLFSDLPEAVDNANFIAQRCAFAPTPRNPVLPKLKIESFADESEALRTLSARGLDKKQLSKPFSQYRERLEYELDVIINMGFAGYFLIVADFIDWGRNNGVSVGPGRGSGAGSVVAWVMGITDVDPLRFGLLFERFLNPERVSLPDFDIDFCQENRDRIIEYVFDKYGHDKVAQIITFGKLQTRAVLRDVGRVLGMPYGAVDRICKMIPNNPAHPVTLAEAIKLDLNFRKEYDEDVSIKKLVDISLQLEGLYRHASVHAAGVIISDDPIEEIMPLYYDQRSNSTMPISQYSMKYVEMAGFIKFDFLGLRTITLINKAVQAIEQYRGINIDISMIALDDKVTFEMLSLGNTAGVFQLEGHTSRKALQQLKPDCLEDIIALISLNRPGPMENIPVYIARKHGNEKADYYHPTLEEVLKETFGVIVYQEQVMNIARVMSGYSLGGADLLRRAMGKKIPKEMAQQRDIFVTGAEKKGIDKKKADEIFDVVDKFSGYGFNKSHAAAYAMISYRTAWLKANYEVEFFIACLNLELNDNDKISFFSGEAKKAGITMLSPDINKSRETFTKEGERGIRYALLGCRNVGAASAEEIVRQRNDGYADIFDFVYRTSSKAVNKKAMESLVAAGVFDNIHPNRHQLMISVPVLLKLSAEPTQKKYQQFDIFGDSEHQIIPLPIVNDWDDGEKLSREFAIFGFYLTGHPLSSFRYIYDVLRISYIENMTSDTDIVFGVINKVSIKSNKRGRYAIIDVSDPSASIMVSIYGKELEQCSEILIEKQMVFIVLRIAIGDDGERRCFAKSVMTFDQFINEKAPKFTLILDVNDNFSAKELSIILRDNISPIGFTICIHAHINGKAASILLPQKYTTDQNMLENISRMVGVNFIKAKSQTLATSAA